ncbi:MAG: hypothetical protein WDZ49_11075, partial [Litorilinea sp.]
GHPTRLIHVAGTGGKGSTCRFVEVGFGASARSGAFMSPHLFDYRERFSVNGNFVARADITRLWETRIQPFCVRRAMRNSSHVHSFHEVSILLALALFEEHAVEWAALETGVGGRYDQTRALDVAATVLTNVGTDHAHILGREAWQRVLDKSGIARPQIPFFTSETDPDALEIIRQVCAAADAPLTVVDESTVAGLTQRLEGDSSELGGALDEDSLLQATYQKWNAALSLAVVRHFLPAIEEGALLQRFAATRLPGRFRKVDEGIYADIAHNSEKMRALVQEIERRFEGHGLIVVIGLSGQRLPDAVFASLSRVAKTIIVTSASFKGQDPEKLRSAIEAVTGDTPTLVISNPRQALGVARSLRNGSADVILLTGSTYMIEQVLNPDPYLRYMSANFGWRTHVDTEATGTVQLTLPKPPPAVR